MSKIPTVKASLDSAAIGLNDIHNSLVGMTTEEVHEALTPERAQEIDALIWEIAGEVDEATDD